MVIPTYLAENPEPNPTFFSAVSFMAIIDPFISIHSKTP